MSARLCALLSAFVVLLALSTVSVAGAAGGPGGVRATSQPNPPPFEVTPEIRAEMKRGEALQNQWRAHRRSAEGRAQRDRSRSRYRGFSRSEAIDLARVKFPEFFAQPVYKEPTLPAGGGLDEFVNDFSFFVRTGNGRERRLVQTTLPSSAVNEQGKRELVSTDLVREGEMLSPENTAAPVAIDSRADGEVEFEQTGVGFSLAGASASEAAVVDDKAVFPDALTDIDYTVAAQPNGVETFLNLRSPEAPEAARLRFDLPADAELRLTENAIGDPGAGDAVGARVVKDGETIHQIQPPAAKDADGAPVPVRYALEGNDLIVKVDHRGGDFLYPILVDPLIDRMGPHNPNFGYGATDGRVIGSDCTWVSWCDSGTGMPGLSGNGLYIHSQAGYYPQAYGVYGVSRAGFRGDRVSWFPSLSRG